MIRSSGVLRAGDVGRKPRGAGPGDQGRAARPRRGDRRRSSGLRIHEGGARSLPKPWGDVPGLPSGWPRAGRRSARVLALQLDHRTHRAGRRHPAGRNQSTLEAPVLNARLRKVWLGGKTAFGLVGEAADLTYGYEHLGRQGGNLAQPPARRFAKAFRGAERPAVINRPGRSGKGRRLGGAEAARPWPPSSASSARVGTAGTCSTPPPPGSAASISVSSQPGRQERAPDGRKGRRRRPIPLGADEVDLSRTDALVIYLGTHGDTGAHRADMSFPAPPTPRKAAFTSTPRAASARRAGRLSQGRGQGRLGDPAGAFGAPWGCLALRYARALRDRLFADIRRSAGSIMPRAPSRRPSILPAWLGRGDQRGAVGEPDRGLPPHQSDRAGERHHGECAALAAGVDWRRNRWRAPNSGLAGRLDGADRPSDTGHPHLAVAFARFPAARRPQKSGRRPDAQGPQRGRSFGLFQSFADLIKFVLKEVVIPDGATRPSSCWRLSPHSPWRSAPGR